MSCSKTVVQEVEKRDGEQSVDFEDSRDKDESKNIFDEENVPSEPVPPPCVSLKLSEVRLILNQEMRGKMWPPLQLCKKDETIAKFEMKL